MPQPDPRKAARPRVPPFACAKRLSVFSGYPESLHSGDSDRTSSPSPCRANRFAQRSYIVLHGASRKDREAATLSGASPHRVEKCCLFPAASYRLSVIPLWERPNSGFPQRATVMRNPFRKARHTQLRVHRKNDPAISSLEPCAYGCAQAWDNRNGTMPPDRREAVSSGHF